MVWGRGMRLLQRYRAKLSSVAPSLFEVEEPKNLWRPDFIDGIAWSIHLTVVAVQWILSFSGGDVLAPYAYWDGPNYIYAAKTMYNIPDDNPWTVHFSYPTYYFACHFPGFPLVVRLFSMIFFNCYWIGYVVAIFFCSCLSFYMFRRMLIVYGCVHDPRWTTLVLCLFPIRYFLYSAVGASEPLYISFCYGAMTFYRIGRKVPMLLCLWGATVTRIEGLSIVGTIGLCYGLRLEILNGLWTSLGFLGPAAVAVMHKQKFGTYRAYFMFNNNLLQFPPFYRLIIDSKYESHVPTLMGAMHLYWIMIAGALILYQQAVPLAIFSTVYLIYSSCLFHIDVHRYSLPGYILCLLVGFDCIWAHPHFKLAAPILGIVYIVYTTGYSAGQMVTNRAWKEFVFDVMKV